MIEEIKKIKGKDNVKVWKNEKRIKEDVDMIIIKGGF